MAKIYLAARYSRRAEMLNWAKILETQGHTITSRWIYGDHETEGFDDATGEQKSRYAAEDFEDIVAADIVISFAEKPRSLNTTRGGRHWEMGAAHALGKRNILISHKEHVFHFLPEVEFYGSISDCPLFSGAFITS